MIFAALGLLLIASAYLPQVWVRYVMKKHHRDQPDLPGTGGELARHLVQRFQLEGIVVEETDEGRDHFDPTAKAVRLSPSNYHGRSVTAVAVAAHEVVMPFSVTETRPSSSFANNTCRWRQN
jgi:uncharacterized protein